MGQPRSSTLSKSSVAEVFDDNCTPKTKKSKKSKKSAQSGELSLQLVGVKDIEVMYNQIQVDAPERIESNRQAYRNYRAKLHDRQRPKRLHRENDRITLHSIDLTTMPS